MMKMKLLAAIALSVLVTQANATTFGEKQKANDYCMRTVTKGSDPNWLWAIYETSTAIYNRANDCTSNVLSPPQTMSAK